MVTIIYYYRDHKLKTERATGMGEGITTTELAERVREMLDGESIGAIYRALELVKNAGGWGELVFYMKDHKITLWEVRMTNKPYAKKSGQARR